MTENALLYLLIGIGSSISFLLMYLTLRGRFTLSLTKKASDTRPVISGTKYMSGEELPDGCHIESIQLNEGEETCLEIMPHTEKQKGRMNPLNVSEEIRDAIGNIIRSAPNLNLLNKAAEHSNTFSIKVNPKFLKGLQTGDLTFMRSKGFEGGFRGNIVNNRHKVVGQASFKNAKSLRSPAALACIWQLASIVVAQAHLTSINKRLADISKGVTDISLWLEDEQISKIEGNLHYLSVLRDAFTKGEISPDEASHWRGQVESIDRECLQIISHIQRTQNRLVNELPNTEKPDIVGTSAFVEKIQEKLDRFGQLQNNYGIAMKVSLVNCQMLTLLNAPEVTMRSRLNHIRTIKKNTTGYADLKENVNPLIGSIDSWFNSKETLRRRKQSIRNRISDIRREGDQLRNNLDASLDENFKLMAAKGTEPTEIIYKQSEEGGITLYR